MSAPRSAPELSSVSTAQWEEARRVLPVIRGLAQHLNWNAVQILAEDDPSTGEDGSRWVVLSQNLPLLQQITNAAPHIGWTEPGRKPILWTDDFASLWHVLKF